MKKQRYCVACAGEVTLKFGLRESESVCPHCGATLRTKRSLFGKETMAAQPPDTTTVITVQYRAPLRRVKKCDTSM